MIIETKRLFILVIVVAYILIYKIPVVCHGCDSESVWYRCVFGTGEGSSACEAHKKVQSIISEGGDIASTIKEQSGVFLDNIWEFTSDDLPDTIKAFVVQIKETLQNLRPAIAAKIQSIIAFLKEKANIIVDKIKGLASSTYENYMKVVIDPLVSFVTNNIITPMVFVIEKIIAFRKLVWGSLTTAVSAVTNLGITDFVGNIVDIVKGIPDVLIDLRDLIIQLINNIKSTIYGSLNWGLESGTNLVNTSVNAMSNTLESGIDASVDIINIVVGGVEDGVGLLTSGINSTMNGVEDTVNGIGNGIESGVNKIVKAVKAVKKGFDGAGTKQIKTWFGTIRPLSFLHNVIPTVSDLSIDDLEIKDLTAPTFDEVTAPDIPTINIIAPVVEEPEDIDPDDMGFGSIPGFGFVEDKISQLKASIRTIFESTMSPLYTAIRTMIALIASIASSVATFFKTYISFSSLKAGINTVLSVVKDQLVNIKKFVLDEVIPSIIDVLKTIKEPILDFIGKVSEKAWAFMKTVGRNAGEMFKKAYNMSTKLIGSVTTNVFHMVAYTAGALSDKLLFFVPGPVTFKLMIVVSMTLYILLGSYVKNMADILKVVFIPVKTAAKTIYETDKSLDILVGIPR